MATLTVLLAGMWHFLATLAYAFLEFLIIEGISIAIFRVNAKYAVQLGSHSGKFRVSEFYVFGVIIFGLISFYVSNALYSRGVAQLELLGWYLIPVLLVLFATSCILLAVLVLKREWGFRLVLIPIVVIIVTVILTQ